MHLAPESRYMHLIGTDRELVFYLMPTWIIADVWMRLMTPSSMTVPLFEVTVPFIEHKPPESGLIPNKGIYSIKGKATRY